MGEPPLLEWLLRMTGFVLPWGANLMVHSTILISAGLFAAWAFRNRGAAVQSLILRITLVAVLLSPLVTLTAGRLGVRGVDIPLPSVVTVALQTGTGAMPERAVLPHTTPVAVALPTASAAPPSAAEVAAYQSARNDVLLHTPPPPALILRIMIPAVIVLWTVLSFLLALRLLFFFIKIHLVRRSAFEARTDLVRVCDKVADELDVEPPLVLQSGVVHSPFLSGLFHPAVLLPLDDEDGEPVTREVFLHELGHLARRDCLWNFLSQIAVTILSIQPLMRVLSCRMEEVSDHVCDDFVVQFSANRQAYARHLFEIAQRGRPTPAELAVGVGIVAFHSSLGQRVERILDHTRRFSLRAGMGTVIRIAILGGAATMLMGITGFRGTVESGMADIVKAVSGHAGEWRAIPVSILMVSGHAPVSKGNKTRPIRDSLPVSTGNSSEANLPEKPVIASPERTASPTVAVTIPTDPAPTPPTIASNPDDAVAGTGDPEAQHRVEPTIRPNVPQEQPAAPIRTVSAVRDEASASAPLQTTDSPVPTAKKPAMKLVDKESCIREGNRMLDAGNYAAAEEAFMKATEFDLKDPEIMNLLGKAYYGKREYSKAIHAYKSAVAKKSNFADAYYNMGDVYLAQGKEDAAMTQYKAAIQLNPAYAKRTRNFF